MAKLTEPMSLLLTAKLKKELEAYAWKNHLRVSEVIRLAITSYLYKKAS